MNFDLRSVGRSLNPVNLVGEVQKVTQKATQKVVQGADAVRDKGAEVARGAASHLPTKEGVLSATSTALDFVPVVGSVKAAVQIVTGRDLLTGEKTDRLADAAGLIPLPVGRLAGTGIKLAGKALRHGDDVGRLAGRAGIPPGVRSATGGAGQAAHGGVRGAVRDAAQEGASSAIEGAATTAMDGETWQDGVGEGFKRVAHAGANEGAVGFLTSGAHEARASVLDRALGGRAGPHGGGEDAGGAASGRASSDASAGADDAVGSSNDANEGANSAGDATSGSGIDPTGRATQDAAPGGVRGAVRDAAQEAGSTAFEGAVGTALDGETWQDGVGEGLKRVVLGGSREGALNFLTNGAEGAGASVLSRALGGRAGRHGVGEDAGTASGRASSDASSGGGDAVGSSDDASEGANSAGDATSGSGGDPTGRTTQEAAQGGVRGAVRDAAKEGASTAFEGAVATALDGETWQDGVGEGLKRVVLGGAKDGTASFLSDGVEGAGASVLSRALGGRAGRHGVGEDAGAASGRASSDSTLAPVVAEVREQPPSVDSDGASRAGGDTAGADSKKLDRTSHLSAREQAMQNLRPDPTSPQTQSADVPATGEKLATVTPLHHPPVDGTHTPSVSTEGPGAAVLELPASRLTSEGPERDGLAPVIMLPQPQSEVPSEPIDLPMAVGGEHVPSMQNSRPDPGVTGGVPASGKRIVNSSGGTATGASSAGGETAGAGSNKQDPSSPTNKMATAGGEGAQEASANSDAQNVQKTVFGYEKRRPISEIDHVGEFAAESLKNLWEKGDQETRAAILDPHRNFAAFVSDDKSIKVSGFNEKNGRHAEKVIAPDDAISDLPEGTLYSDRIPCKLLCKPAVEISGVNKVHYLIPDTKKNIDGAVNELLVVGRRLEAALGIPLETLLLDRDSKRGKWRTNGAEIAP